MHQLEVPLVKNCRCKEIPDAACSCCHLHIKVKGFLSKHKNKVRNSSINGSAIQIFNGDQTAVALPSVTDLLLLLCMPFMSDSPSLQI